MNKQEKLDNLISKYNQHKFNCSFCNGTITKNGQQIFCEESQELEDKILIEEED